MIPIDFLPGARLDFDQSFDWYAERSEIAAGRFSNAVDVALAAIAANPEQFAAIDDRHRENGFHFALFITLSQVASLWLPWHMQNVDQTIGRPATKASWTCP
jgi:hypothetical protein